MEEEKQLIFSLAFDTDQGLKKAAEFRKALDKDKEALAALNKEIKTNAGAEKEQLLQREKLEKSIRENTRARKEQLHAVDKYIQATKNATDADGKYNGSIKNLRGSLSYLTEQWNGLSKAERENSQVGGVLQKEIKRLSDELKELEGSVGDNRRSVGGYLDAIRQAPGAMGKFRAGIDGISTAMRLNPIGLLVTALQILPGLFAKSGDGADFFAKTMLQINSIFEVGLKRVVGLGDSIALLLQGKFSEAGKSAKGAVTGFGDAVRSAVKNAGDLAVSLDALDIAESRFTVTSAKARKEIDQLLIQARNRSISEKERIALLELAEKKEVELNKTALSLARERLKLIKQENELRQDDYEEEEKRVNEQLAKIADLERDSLNIQEKIQVRKDALADANLEKEKKRQDQRLKNYEAHRKDVQNQLDLFQKFIDQLKAGREKQLEEDRKFIEDSKKVIDKQFQNSEKARNATNAQREAENKQREQDAQDEIDRKQKVFKATVDFSNATSQLMSLIAKDNSELAEFEKALALFRIGLASAEAITKGIANSQSMPFPGNMIAMGTTIATITANLIQAKQLIDEPPKTKFAEGGVLSGPSHAEGGIKGTGSFAGIEVEGGEAIINKRSTAMFAPILSALNQIGGGKALAPTRYAALGGLISATNRASGVPEFDYNKLARSIAAENSKLQIVVKPTEVVNHYNQTESRKVRAGIGK